MLTERTNNFLVLLFFGVLIIYVLNTPPAIVVKHPIIDKMTNVSFIEQN